MSDHDYISSERAGRCMAVVFADNEPGLDTAAQLLSNMFDIDRQTAWIEMHRHMEDKKQHLKEGGGLREFEAGLIRRNNDVCPAGHENHERVKIRDKEYWRIDGTYYHIETSPMICKLLEKIRKDGTRVRFHWGDTITGRDFGDSYDVEGRLGRSSGPVKVPILLHNRRSMGGSHILDHCIVKIVETKGKRVIYQHALYHTEEDK